MVRFVGKHASGHERTAGRGRHRIGLVERFRPRLEQLDSRDLPSFTFGGSFAVGLGAASVAMADINGDGKLDLLVANRASDSVSVLLGNGNGTVQSAQDLAVGAAPSAVAVADLNRDGKPDLVVANAGSNAVN